MAPIERNVGFALGATLSMLFRAKPRLARLFSILAPATPQFSGTQPPPISLQISAPYLLIFRKYRMQSKAVVSSKGQVTLPAAMRKILGIVAGSHIHFAHSFRTAWQRIGHQARASHERLQGHAQALQARPGRSGHSQGAGPGNLVNLVDSSGWIEYLPDTPRAEVFASAFRAARTLAGTGDRLV